MLNSIQFEELCRFFLSRELNLPVDAILSVSMPNPGRPDLPKYKHQIDLYWETGDSVSSYLNIANAKWRSSEKVDQPEVLLLNQVRQDLFVHKAVMITNTDFTAGAKAVAENKGIALHIVSPLIAGDQISEKDRPAIQGELSRISAQSTRPPFDHKIVCKALETAGTQVSKPGPASAASTTRATVSPSTTKILHATSSKVISRANPPKSSRGQSSRTGTFKPSNSG